MTCATVSSTQHTYSTDGAPKRTVSLDTDSHLWNSDCDTRAHTFNSMWKERGDKTQQRKTKQNRKRRQFKLWCLCICTAWSHAYAYVALMSPNRTLLAKQLAYSIRSEWVGDEHFHYGQLSTTRLMTVGSGLYVLVSGVYLVQLDPAIRWWTMHFICDLTRPYGFLLLMKLNEMQTQQSNWMRCVYVCVSVYSPLTQIQALFSVH